MSKKPVALYMAVYIGRSEGAQFRLEAKSDRGAARIAASYELDEYGFAACELVDLLRWDGRRFVGLPRHFVEDATHWPKPRTCGSCGQHFHGHAVKRVGDEWLCVTCLGGHAILRVELAWSPLAQLPQYLIALGASAREVAELHLPGVPIFEEANEVCI